MPEWVYWIGWIAVPIAAVAMSGWWRERQNHVILDQWLREAHDAYMTLVTQNAHLRAELNRIDRERADLAYAMFDAALLGENQSLLEAL